jgi:integrase
MSAETRAKSPEMAVGEKFPHELLSPARHTPLSHFSEPTRLGRGWYENHDNMITREFLPLFDKPADPYAETEYNEPVPRFNWHALRHFAISCWIEAGLAPKTVQTFAGHGSLAVIMDRYGHLFKSDGHKDTIARGLF